MKVFRKEQLLGSWRWLLPGVVALLMIDLTIPDQIVFWLQTLEIDRSGWLALIAAILIVASWAASVVGIIRFGRRKAQFRPIPKHALGICFFVLSLHSLSIAPFVVYRINSLGGPFTAQERAQIALRVQGMK